MYLKYALAGVLLAGIVSCAEVIPVETVVEPDLAVYEHTSGVDGSFGVGHRDWDHTYPDFEGNSRTIRINIWYPTRDFVAEDEEVFYLDDTSITRDVGILRDAKMAGPIDGARYPVVVFSHGHVAWGGAAGHVAKNLASNGWIVAGPDHTNNTLTDTPGSGDWESPAIWVHRPLDISATYDAVVEEFGSQVDPDRYFLHGHSRGGRTTLLASGAVYTDTSIDGMCSDSDNPCSEKLRAALAIEHSDDRIVASLTTGSDYDFGTFGSSVTDRIDIPVAIMNGSNDGNKVAVSKPFRKYFAGTGVRWFDIEGGCHPTFETSPLSCATLDEVTGWEIARTYASAFAQFHLLGARGEATDIIDGVVEVSDIASVHIP